MLHIDERCSSSPIFSVHFDLLPFEVFKSTLPRCNIFILGAGSDPFRPAFIPRARSVPFGITAIPAGRLAARSFLTVGRQYQSSGGVPTIVEQVTTEDLDYFGRRMNARIAVVTEVNAGLLVW